MYITDTGHMDSDAADFDLTADTAAADSCMRSDVNNIELTVACVILSTACHSEEVDEAESGT